MPAGFAPKVNHKGDTTNALNHGLSRPESQSMPEWEAAIAVYKKKPGMRPGFELDIQGRLN